MRIDYSASIWPKAIEFRSKDQIENKKKKKRERPQKKGTEEKCYDWTHHVSKLLNFFVTTLPKSIPSRSTIRWAKSGCEEPENTLMFGILDCSFSTLDCSKLLRTKLLARMGFVDRTGITQSTAPAIHTMYRYFVVVNSVKEK